MADRQQRRGQARRGLEAAELEARADRHQAERERRQADALQRGRHRFGQLQAGEVGGEARHSARDQRIAHDLACVAVAAVACQRPHRGHVAQRHAQRDQQRDRGHALRTAQPLGQRQRNEGVEAERRLRARRVQPRIGARPQAQRVSQPNAAGDHADAGQHQADRRARLQRALDDGVEQQHREQHVVDELLDPVPDTAAERGKAAEHEAAKDEQKVGDEQQRVRHAASGPAATRAQAAPARRSTASVGGCARVW